jgi:hypothetical protein
MLNALLVYLSRDRTMEMEVETKLRLEMEVEVTLLPSRLVILAPRSLRNIIPTPMPSSLLTPASTVDAPTCKSVRSWSSVAAVEEEEDKKATRPLLPLPITAAQASPQAPNSSLENAVVMPTALLGAVDSGLASVLVPLSHRNVMEGVGLGTRLPTMMLLGRFKVLMLRRLLVFLEPRRVVPVIASSSTFFLFFLHTN